MLDAANRAGTTEPWVQQLRAWSKQKKDEISAVRQNRKFVIDRDATKWEGPTESKLDEYDQLTIPFTACITNIWVSVIDKPAITITPSGLNVSNFRQK
jgi:hypothetical protein